MIGGMIIQVMVGFLAMPASCTSWKPTFQDYVGEWYYCWWKKSCTSWYIVYPIIYKVYIFQLVQDFFHQPYFTHLFLLIFGISFWAW